MKLDLWMVARGEKGLLTIRDRLVAGPGEKSRWLSCSGCSFGHGQEGLIHSSSVRAAGSREAMVAAERLLSGLAEHA